MSVEEILAFYKLPDCNDSSVTTERPYTWSNSVITLDGFMHFRDEDQDVGLIGLKHLDTIAPYQQADWRLLNAGWAFSDAVLITGQILRDEANADCFVSFPDLVDMRVSTLGKDTQQPRLVILSSECNFLLDRPCFHHADQPVVIFTTSRGKANFEQKLDACAALAAEKSRFTVEEFHGTLKTLLHALKERYQVRYLDISSGGRVIRTCIDEELLDEFRMTTAGQLIGPLSSTGERRPSLFPDSGRSYSAHNSPLVAWKAIRSVGDHFVFYRGMVQYRTS
ncbi:hypothetical protein HDU91_007189 [Kappamyces sp. JEL0680]|nr:hypothetical protein HDU91_007189 [Kappamyces sp. JEL0680]